MKKKSYAYEAIIILGIVILLSFFCRLWLLVLLGILGIIIATIRMVFLKSKESAKCNEKIEVKEPIVAEPTEKDVMDLAYSVILKRISQLVKDIYPDAKWVWEKPNSKNLIFGGESVYIILNNAGGYQRALVQIENLRATALKFDAPKVVSVIESKPEMDFGTVTEQVEEIVNKDVNYELVAFEWVDKHILELNERCNEVMGKGETELRLMQDELPAAESWTNICSELVRVGLKNVECVSDGIKIILN